MAEQVWSSFVPSKHCFHSFNIKTEHLTNTLYSIDNSHAFLIQESLILFSGISHTNIKIFMSCISGISIYRSDSNERLFVLKFDKSSNAASWIQIGKKADIVLYDNSQNLRNFFLQKSASSLLESANKFSRKYIEFIFWRHDCNQYDFSFLNRDNIVKKTIFKIHIYNRSKTPKDYWFQLSPLRSFKKGQNWYLIIESWCHSELFQVPIPIGIHFCSLWQLERINKWSLNTFTAPEFSSLINSLLQRKLASKLPEKSILV